MKRTRPVRRDGIEISFVLFARFFNQLRIFNHVFERVSQKCRQFKWKSEMFGDLPTCRKA